MSAYSGSPRLPATFSCNGTMRTPPVDAGSFSPGSTSSVHSMPHKIAPASRDGGSKGSPHVFTAPQWGVKHSPRSADGHFGSVKGVSPDGMTRSVSLGAWSGEGGLAGHSTRLFGNHSRNQSASQAHSPSRFGPSSPDLLPPRPDSPTFAEAPAPPPALHPPSQVSANGAPIFNKVDFSFGQSEPLDLGIELDPVHSTYKETKAGPTAAQQQTPPVVEVSSPARPEDEPGTPYAAQVRVSVAQRVERAPSARKGSLAELSIERHTSGPLFDSRRTSNATTASAPSSQHRRPSADLSVPQLRPPRATSPGGTSRAIGQGERSSYAGSTASSVNPAPAGVRRASSVYVPNNSSIGITAPLSASVGAGPGGQLITPGAKLPLNLLSLARRTAHISDVPGYAWRLNLLEKLEVIMGCFLTIQDAEAILSIGNSAPEKRSNRRESRKSQIGMPTPSSENLKAAMQDRQRMQDRSSFFGRMKRVLGNPHAGLVKGTPPPLPTARKTVFGTSLSQVAEYGFVTSMIAGQRHDLPGVVFSAVEEIYRRGHGTKVPGLMQLQGELGRVSKLVQIYDTPPDYGEHHDLSIESIHNVTSLLKRYLRDLPDPVLDQRLWRLFLVACVDSSNSVKARIASAQIILRLLPTANFSLLVYMVAFLSQMPLFPENRLTLEQVSSLFGSSLMSPRPAPQQKKPAKGEMVITGPTETVESVGEAAKKGRAALGWLLNHWSSVADGLLEPDFDIDPDTIVDAPLPSPAPTVDVADPEAELYIRRPAHGVDPLVELPAAIQPREAPAPPVAMLPWSAQQNKAISPVIEQSTAEISPIPRFDDVVTAYRSGPSSPGAALERSPSSALRNGIEYSPRVKRPTAAPSTGSHGSPAVLHDAASPSLYGDGTESAGASPSKAFSYVFAPPVPAIPAQHVQAAAQQAETGEGEQEDEDTNQGDDSHASARATSVSHHSPNGSGSDAPHMSPTRSSQSTISELGSEVRTPPSSTHTRGHTGSLVTAKAVGWEQDQEKYVPVVARKGDPEVLLDLDDTSVYAFPPPPLAAPIPTHPSPFLPPSPFLTQAEIAAALAAERERELAQLPTPANPANYADRTGLHEVSSAPQVLSEKSFAPATADAVERVQDAAPLDAYERWETAEEAAHDERALVPLSTSERAVVPVAKEVVPAVIASAAEYEDAPPPVPLKAGMYAPRAFSGSSGFVPPPSSTTPQPPATSSSSTPLAARVADFEPRLVHPSADAPCAGTPALFRSKDEQLRDAHATADAHRKELQQLWAQLTDLELERTAERSEMIDLRQEVESFKARMAKRLSRSLDEGERRRLEDAEARARDAERARADVDALRREAALATEEARRAREELARVEELRRKEQADARSQIEALEAQLGSIRAVLLGGGAGFKI